VTRVRFEPSFCFHWELVNNLSWILHAFNLHSICILARMYIKLHSKFLVLRRSGRRVPACPAVRPVSSLCRCDDVGFCKGVAQSNDRKRENWEPSDDGAWGWIELSSSHHDNKFTLFFKQRVLATFWSVRYTRWEEAPKYFLVGSVQITGVVVKKSGV